MIDLNIPVVNQLKGCRNLLIAGMGGGYDVFCGLPIYFELRKQGVQVHLANYSFADITSVRHGIRLTESLVGVTPDAQRIYPYFPEFYLAQWFHQVRQETIPIWCFQKTGALPLLRNYEILVNHLAIDGILLVDGGVDSLLQGNEYKMGTLIEDSISLCAVNQLTHIPVRMLTCIGLGAEQDITYRHVFENIAGITQAGGMLGACSLIPQMEVYQLYDAVVSYVQSQPIQDPSVINSSIVSAVRGAYGDFHLTEKTQGSRLWISPLMALYWFFDLECVAKKSLVLSTLADTLTFRDALYRVMECQKTIPRRPDGRVPL